MRKIKESTRIQLELMSPTDREQLDLDYQALVEEYDQFEADEELKQICGYYSYRRAMAYYGRRAIRKLLSLYNHSEWYDSPKHVEIEHKKWREEFEARMEAYKREWSKPRRDLSFSNFNKDWRSKISNRS